MIGKMTKRKREECLTPGGCHSISHMDHAGWRLVMVMPRGGSHSLRVSLALVTWIPAAIPAVIDWRCDLQNNQKLKREECPTLSNPMCWREREQLALAGEGRVRVGPRALQRPASARRRGYARRRRHLPQDHGGHHADGGGLRQQAQGQDHRGAGLALFTGLALLFTTLFCTVRTPVDDSRCGPCNQPDTPGRHPGVATLVGRMVKTS